MDLSSDVRARLDAHLDAVEKALVEAKCPRERRRGVVDDLEAQITDMLAAQGGTPTVPDLEGVLAKLDPPAAYGEASATHSAPPAATTSATRCGLVPGESQFGPTGPLGVKNPFGSPPKTRYSRTAILGFICILVSVLPLLLVVPALFFFRLRAVPSPAPAEMRIEAAPASMAPRMNILSLEPGIVLAALDVPRATRVPQLAMVGVSGLLFGIVPCVGIFGLLGTVLGWVAFFQIRASQGALSGTGLALFDGLFYLVPLALLLMLKLAMVALVVLAVAAVVIGIWLLIRRIPALR